MIRVSKDNDAGRALRLVVAYPGEYDGPGMAAELWRQKPPPRFNSPAEYAAWRREHTIVKEVERPPKRSALKSMSGRARNLPPTHVVRLVDDNPLHAKASRILSRMQEAGYVETAGGPRASDWFMVKVQKHGIRKALAMVLMCDVEDVPPALLRMVTIVVEDPPPSVRALLGVKPSGRRTEVYRHACEIAVIIPPNRRIATAAGVALVASWDAP